MTASISTALGSTAFQQQHQAPPLLDLLLLRLQSLPPSSWERPSALPLRWPRPYPSRTAFQQQHQAPFLLLLLLLLLQSLPPSLWNRPSALPLRWPRPYPSRTAIYDDIQPKPDGRRPLLPFFTTNNRLRLSECAPGLLKFRNTLARVKLVPRTLPASSNASHLLRGLRELLKGQDECEVPLVYLRVSHKSLLPVLDLASWGCFEGLKNLDLSDLATEREGALGERVMGPVLYALESGGLKGLEELNFKGCHMEAAAYTMMLGLLSEGFCPRLHRMFVTLNYLRSGPNDALAEALKSGHLQQLQELELSHGYLTDARGVAMAQALQHERAPKLTKLELSFLYLCSVTGEALGEAMSSDTFRELEHLGLQYICCFPGEDNLLPVFEAIGAGCLPSLKQLDLCSADLPAQSVITLGNAIRAGQCHRLQRLDLRSAFGEHDAVLNFLIAIREGGKGVLPSLLHLNLSRTMLGDKHGLELGKAIKAGALPELRELDLSANKLLYDGGVERIMEGLGFGGCHGLEKLDLSDTSTGLRGCQALTRAIASGNLSHLQPEFASMAAPLPQFMLEGDMLLSWPIPEGDMLLSGWASSRRQSGWRAAGHSFVDSSADIFSSSAFKASI